MPLFQRIKNLLAKPEPVRKEKSMLSLHPGDICEVSLITYQVTGRTQNRSRNSVILTLQDGTAIKYLSIEDREKTVYTFYEPIDGRLDTFEEVPTTLELDGQDYHMDEHYSGLITASGKTPFMQGGEQHVWQYQADDRRLLRIEWLDGRFMLYIGESVLAADVQVVRGV